jgi:hypothetical protein
MQSPLESILAKPHMYCGKQFSSIDEFSLFFHGLSVGLSLNQNTPTADAAAIAGFGGFMRHYLHGRNKNCHWEYDLLSEVGSHDHAVQSASVLLLHFRDLLSTEGVDRIDQVLMKAKDVRAYWGADRKFHVQNIDRESDENA